jgi:enoyl-[acyl-carrier protein] reductase/trans-2-enoyl-CoA reductase (NAD+)
VIGASTGWVGFETSAFGSNAGTIRVFFENLNRGKTASPGWYNSAAFEQEAHAAGLYAKVSTEMPFLMVSNKQ